MDYLTMRYQAGVKFEENDSITRTKLDELRSRIASMDVLVIIHTVC
jgi:hypothetical protein